MCQTYTLNIFNRILFGEQRHRLESWRRRIFDGDLAVDLLFFANFLFRRTIYAPICAGVRQPAQFAACRKGR